VTIRRTTSILLVILLTGCGGLLRRVKSNFFSLERIAPAGPVAQIGGVPIALDAVELPPGFDRREVVVRQADMKLEVRERDQWTASLEPMVTHTLAFNLASRLPEGMVILPGQTKPMSPTRSIDLMVADLVAGPQPVVLLDARWIVREAGRPELVRHERITTPIPSLDSANIASGMSQALAELADRIVAQLNSAS
jgi:uncharacterized lipoprotein YmbA